ELRSYASLRWVVISIRNEPSAVSDLQPAVIGGGVAQAGPLLLDPLARHLTTYAALPFTHHLTLHTARLGTDAGLIGAAALTRRTRPAPR
ncbi:ROK family protein, partial [Kitasatospora cineracea]|uniref:ROK family protein n=1 Tax=Kitasatospora cineracea TaxID=88074 RepID=UPI0033E0236D